MKRLSKLASWSKVTTAIVNDIIEQINWLRNVKVSGGLGYSESAHGPSIWAGGTTIEFGKLYMAKTQAAAGANNYISVKLVDVNGNVVGDEFNAYAMFQDGATALNQCLPDIQNNTPVSVFKSQYGSWILNMTLTKFTECT